MNSNAISMLWHQKSVTSLSKCDGTVQSSFLAQYANGSIPKEKSQRWVYVLVDLMIKAAVSDILTGDANEMQWQMVSPHSVGEAAERDNQRTCVPLQDVASVTKN